MVWQLARSEIVAVTVRLSLSLRLRLQDGPSLSSDFGRTLKVKPSASPQPLLPLRRCPDWNNRFYDGHFSFVSIVEKRWITCDFLIDWSIDRYARWEEERHSLQLNQRPSDQSANHQETIYRYGHTLFAHLHHCTMWYSLDYRFSERFSYFCPLHCSPAFIVSCCPYNGTKASDPPADQSRAPLNNGDLLALNRARGWENPPQPQSPKIWGRWEELYRLNDSFRWFCGDGHGWWTIDSNARAMSHSQPDVEQTIHRHTQEFYNI